MCTVYFLDELNDIESRSGDIRNACITARTSNKIVFNSGPEFYPFGHAAHMILIKIALYGLKSLGTSFHSRLLDALTALGFFPYLGGSYISMCDVGDYYSYVVCYCDGLIVVHKEPGYVF